MPRIIGIKFLFAYAASFTSNLPSIRNRAIDHVIDESFPNNSAATPRFIDNDLFKFLSRSAFPKFNGFKARQNQIGILLFY